MKGSFLVPIKPRRVAAAGNKVPRWGCEAPSTHLEGEAPVNEAGKPEFVHPNVARAKLLELIAALPPCVIGMEACSGAHHWARLFMAHGHTVRLMAPKFVSPYRLFGKRGKNDAADAAAICEAVHWTNMRFVPIKSQEQQSQLSVHRVRQGFKRQPSIGYAGCSASSESCCL